MKIGIKKFAVGIVMLAVIVFTLSYAVYAAYDFKILINGNPLECVQPPIIHQGRTLVPMRDVFEGLGATVLWDDVSRSATGTYKTTVITIYPDSGKILKNGEQLALSVKPVIVNDRILIPIRVIAESFGYNVMWRGEDYTVSISTDAAMKIHFLDCGQADSIFIEFPDGKCMLVDAAESSFGKTLEHFIHSLGYYHIDYVVATHPHSDHIGGMAHILDSFSVGTFYMPEASYTTKTFEKMLDALSLNGCECKYISQGDIISDSPYNITVLSPGKSNYSRINNYSAVLKLSYKGVSAILSADAEIDAESEIIGSGANIAANVLKLGHHGSITSTSEAYLEAISPRDAVISVGEKNPYGFPSKIITARLEKRGINTHRTDIDGNISMTTDGYIYIIESTKKQTS